MSRSNKILLAVLSLGCIAGSALWIHHWKYKRPKFNVTLHRGVGEVMARETARIVGNKGKVVVIAIDATDRPELKTQLRAFEDTLRAMGQYHIKDELLDTKGQAKYDVGSGLSGRRYARLAGKIQDADAFVSFIGAPDLKDEELAQLTNKPPKLIAEARSTDHLPKLFENKLIEVAVVSRFEFPSPGTDNPRTREEWFTKRYQVVTATNAVSLPKPEKGE
jgi:hypothetical protein